MTISSNLGFPRIGPGRALKWALERYWSGQADEAGLLEDARRIRHQNWQLQRELGLDHVPSNDFSLYDHVLDTAVMVGAVPELETSPLAAYFAIARGATVVGRAVPAWEMTKWFDTNYHYLVPELSVDTRFRLDAGKPLQELAEAAAAGISTRPVLLGPVSFLLLAKSRAGGSWDPLEPLPRLVPIYEELLASLAEAGATWVQVDEPMLAGDLGPDADGAFASTYRRLADAAPQLQILLAAYFSGLRANLDLALRLPVAALHLDLVREPSQLDQVLASVPPGLALSLGVVDGRNVWRADLDAALATLERAVAQLGRERTLVAPSCSLLHCPLDVTLEEGLDPQLRSWLAFATQKVTEVVTLARALEEGRDAVAPALEEARAARQGRRESPAVHDPLVQRRLSELRPEMEQRGSTHAERKAVQEAALRLPVLPTTTIGSYPQTPEVRRARAEFRRGDLDLASYERFLEAEIAEVVRFQEEIGLDVLVHGEPERTDMVEYFGAQLRGFAFTNHGWVQSYGSRCVKPPILYGDVSRPEPMTVRWARYAQSLTGRPMKGMLTGPVTILRWSFARDDQPAEDTCRQIALAIRDEFTDLEAAGIKVIQVDEPAFRENLTLHRQEWKEDLEWAVSCFRLAVGGASDETQVHTHMCYSQFDELIGAITALDADVLLIEASRSKMGLLGVFAEFEYPNDVGVGVYDIHSPLVPTAEEMTDLLKRACEVLSPDHLWVHPDCGLKTRRWDEVRPSLAHMIGAARAVRISLRAPSSEGRAPRAEGRGPRAEGGNMRPVPYRLHPPRVG